jgi:putative hydrolase of the HAD superfamily
MPRDARAIIFDLDDTLYPLRRFVRSGFVAVAAELERGYGIDSRKALSVLTSAMRGETRGRELQVCADRFRLPDAVVGDLVNIIRLHQPAIRLPRASIDAIETLRGRWRVGVLTNGLPDLQARKVESLGLRFLVDAVVYANAVGDGRGKPAQEPFQEISRKLGVPAVRTVFVGNDDRCDVLGAACAGMRTIHVGGQSCFADAEAESMADVPALAEQLVTEDWSFDVA